jgi:hypothetical protein
MAEREARCNLQEDSMGGMARRRPRSGEESIIEWQVSLDLVWWVGLGGEQADNDLTVEDEESEGQSKRWWRAATTTEEDGCVLVASTLGYRRPGEITLTKLTDSN